MPLSCGGHNNVGLLLLRETLYINTIILRNTAIQTSYYTRHCVFSLPCEMLPSRLTLTTVVAFVVEDKYVND